MATMIEKMEGYRYTRGTASSPSSHEVYYMFVDIATNDNATCRSIIQANLPPTYDSSVLKNWSIDQIKSDTKLIVRATYQNRETSTDKPQELDGEQFSFDTTGYTERITVDLGEIWMSEGAPYLGGAIGYDGERVNGTDVVRPQFNFNLRKQYYTKDMTDKLQQVIANLTGTVNQGRFGPYEAESVLFLGGSGSDSNGIFTVTYGFSYRKNRTEHPFGPFTIPYLPGWWYAEAQYEDTVDSNSTQLIKEMKHAYARKIYELSDFSQLELNF